MEFEKLTAQVRTGRKKGVARRLRREGLIPAVCYGPEVNPVALSIDPEKLSEALHGPLGRNVVIEMTVEGEGSGKEPVLVMLQDYQYHPIARDILHADFLQVSTEIPVSIRIPFLTTGKSVGVQTGGVLQQVFRDLPIECLPKDIPPHVELDVSALEVGDLLKVSDLELPAGVTIGFEETQTLVSVAAPTVAAAEDEEPEEEEGEEGAEEAETPDADAEE